MTIGYGNKFPLIDRSNVSFRIPTKLLENIDKWGIENEYSSRTRTICKILEIGLKTLKDDEVKNHEMQF